MPEKKKNQSSPQAKEQAAAGRQLRRPLPDFRIRRIFMPESVWAKSGYWLVFLIWFACLLYGSFYYYKTEILPIGQENFDVNLQILGQHFLLFFICLILARISTNVIFFGSPLRTWYEEKVARQKANPIQP